ncbi:hypothetical protein OF83DRAFT_1173167 [Amylostereum chailletii]|nr:hypothetical protein OF83DRAFT_1173167 [Amylostereum chailletii]
MVPAPTRSVMPAVQSAFTMSESPTLSPGNEQILNLTVALTGFTQSVTASQRPFALETALFGVFTLLIILSTWILVQRGLRTVPNLAMLLSTLIMYGTATTHWALQLHSLSALSKGLLATESAAANCLSQTALPLESCASAGVLFPTDVAVPVNADQVCVPTILLPIDIVLGDAIVVWRAGIFWSRKWALCAVSAALLLLTLVTSILDSRNACTRSGGGLLAELRVGTSFRVAACVASLATNAWATSLIGYKAWRHRELVRSHFQDGGTSTMSEKIMTAALRGFVVAYEVVESELYAWHAISGPLAVRFNRIGSDFVKSGLIHVTGIYPTVIIVLVCLEKTHCDRNFTYDQSAFVAPAVPL